MKALHLSFSVLVLLVLGACVAARPEARARSNAAPSFQKQREGGPPVWQGETGDADEDRVHVEWVRRVRSSEEDDWIEPWPYVVQGMIGLTDVTSSVVELSDPADVILDEGFETLPMVGGAWQVTAWEPGFDLGFEAGATLSYERDRGRVSVGSGAATVVSRNEYLLIDGFVGLYANLPLGRRWRVYGGAGPLLQFAHVEVDFNDENGLSQDHKETGFSTGWYVRGGVEILIRSGASIGLGWRHVDSAAELSGGFEDLEYEAEQILFTMTKSY